MAKLGREAPPDRDRVADLLRLVSIGMVVVGHWMVAAVLLVDGEVVGTQLIALVPEAQPVTWIFQVMPVFFAVGGYVNRGSWERARTAGDTAANWIRRRARRLLVPLVPVLLVWATVSAVVLGAVDVDGGLMVQAVEAALLPIWFLAVYLATVALVPWSVRLHERLGASVPMVATLLIVVVDLAHRDGVPYVGFLTYLLVWGGAHQLGYLWSDRDHWPAAPAAVLAVTASLVTLGLVTFGGYPLSMVAVEGAATQNTDPPSLALWTFACAQLFALVALDGPLRRWIADDRRYGAVIVGGGAVLTVFLWHMTALVIVAATLVTTGLWPAATGGVDGAWWAWRPVWLLACAVTLAPLVAALRRFEGAGEPVGDAGGVRTAGGTVASVAGIALLMTQGLASADTEVGLRVGPLLLTVLGLAALGVLRPARTRGAR